MKRIATVFLTSLIVITSVLQASASEYLITGIGIKETFKGFPYTFDKGNLDIGDWVTWSTITKSSTDEGTLSIGFEESAVPSGSQIGAYILLKNTFTVSDCGKYRVKFKLKINSEGVKDGQSLWAGYSFANNIYRTNAIMPATNSRRELIKDNWLAFDEEIEITKNDAESKGLIGKTCYFFIYLCHRYVSEPINTILNDKALIMIDSVNIYKENFNPADAGGKWLNISCDVLPKSDSESETLELINRVTIDEDIISEEIKASFQYPGETSPSATICVTDITDANTEFYLRNSNGNVVSPIYNVLNFFKNGVNLIADEGFENNKLWWDIAGRTASITAEGIENSNCLKLEGTTRATISAPDMSKVLQAYGVGGYLIEFNIKSNGKVSVIASLTGDTESCEINCDGQWEYYSSQLYITDISKAVKDSLQIKIEGEHDIFIDNIAVKKVMDY